MFDFWASPYANELHLESVMGKEDRDRDAPSRQPNHADGQGQASPLASTQEAESFLRLLAEARGGSSEALGKLANSNQNYLLLIANQEIHVNVQAKVGASDVVQETLATAHRKFSQFQGDSPEEDQ